VKLNQVAHLQTEVAHAYIRERNLKPADFIDHDHKYGILRFMVMPSYSKRAVEAVFVLSYGSQ